MGIIEIKRVTVDDIAELQKIGRETFLETFSESNNEENMASYLSESFSEIKLIKELNNAGSEFYFAVDNNTVIGYLKLNTGKSQSEI